MTSPTDAELRTLVAESVRRVGVAETSRRLGTDPQTTLRLVAGTPVRRGSMALARANVGRLGDGGMASPSPSAPAHPKV